MTNATTSTATTTPVAGDNIEQAIGTLNKTMTSLGAAEGKGSASRPLAGVALTKAAYEGLIDETDAEAMYNRYQSGVASVSSKNPLSNPAESTSTKAQVSKFRQFIKLGALPGVDGRVVLDRAVTVQQAMISADTPVYSPFDAMLNVAREQMKQPDTELTDDQITAAVCKPDKKEKGDMDKLIAAYKSAHKLAADLPSPNTEAALDAYRDAIVEAGGDVPAMTKEEKKAAEAMAFLASKGMVGVPALPRH